MNEKERLASEAERLLNEPLLVQALDTIMSEAFADFKQLKVSPETIPEVIALQQRIVVCQEIVGNLQAVITASGRRDGGVPLERKPTVQ